MSILLQSCVGWGERTTPTTLQEKGSVFLLLAVTPHPEVFVPSRWTQGLDFFDKCNDFISTSIHFHWRLHLLVQEAFDLI